MNPQSIVASAIERGWMSPSPETLRRNFDKTREVRRHAGLTARGTPPKPKGINPAVLAAAQRDGVTVTAIYNRLARTGRLTLRKKP